MKVLRVEHIGSLARPPELLIAQGKYDDGDLGREDLISLENQLISAVLSKQEEIGFPMITDGEFRRRNFQDSFGDAVSGYDSPSTNDTYNQWQKDNKSSLKQRVDSGPQIAGPPVVTRRPTLERLFLKRNIPLEEYEYVSENSKTPAKVTLIGPDRVAQRFEWESSKGVYEGLADFINHVAQIQHEMVSQLAIVGCPYVHIDAPGYTAYVDGPSLQKMRIRGEDPDANLRMSIDADNKVIEGIENTIFGIHLCKGNSRGVDPKTGEIFSQWHREGFYDAIAEQIFTGLNHDRFMLEYDDARSGTFEALRFVPKNKIVVLGLVTTKSLRVESVDELLQRIEEATKYIDVDQLAISPQCGFASGAAGALPEDVQWRKLEVILNTAEKVWGLN